MTGIHPSSFRSPTSCQSLPLPARSLVPTLHPSVPPFRHRTRGAAWAVPDSSFILPRSSLRFRIVSDARLGPSPVARLIVQRGAPQERSPLSPRERVARLGARHRIAGDPPSGRALITFLPTIPTSQYLVLACHVALAADRFHCPGACHFLPFSSSCLVPHSCRSCHSWFSCHFLPLPWVPTLDKASFSPPRPASSVRRRPAGGTPAAQFPVLDGPVKSLRLNRTDAADLNRYLEKFTDCDPAESESCSPSVQRSRSRLNGRRATHRADFLAFPRRRVDLLVFSQSCISLPEVDRGRPHSRFDLDTLRLGRFGLWRRDLQDALLVLRCDAVLVDAGRQR